MSIMRNGKQKNRMINETILNTFLTASFPIFLIRLTQIAIVIRITMHLQIKPNPYALITPPMSLSENDKMTVALHTVPNNA